MVPSQQSIEIKKTIEKDKLDESVPISVKRQEWEDYARSLPLPETVTQEAETIGDVPCLWVKAEHACDDYVIFYLHGGGLVEGSAITTREFAARLSMTTRIPVLIVDYRLAPEHPYPAALDDVQAVYKRLIEQRYPADRVILGGDSNGGGLVLSTLLALRDSNVSLPKCGFLISPVVDLTFSGESMVTNADVDPFTSQEVLIHCAKLYAPSADLRSPYISPLFADLTNMPNLLIQAERDEILLSDSTRLAEKLTSQGNHAELKIWSDLWHVWHYFSDLPEAQQAIEEIQTFLYQQLDL